MNFAQQLARLNHARSRGFDFDVSERDPLALICQLFNTANDLINEKVQSFKGYLDLTLSTSSSFTTYSLPPDMIDNLILEGGLELIFNDGTRISPTLIDEAQARQLYGAGFTNPNNIRSANHWWYAVGGGIGLFYPPQKAGVMRVTYVKQPTPFDPDTCIWRSEDHTGYAAEFLKGIPGISFTPGLPEIVLAEGDQIGQGTIPSSWYEVGEPITLIGVINSCPINQNYRGADDAAGSFVISKVSEVVKVAGSKGNHATGMLPVWYALSQLMMDSDPKQAETYAVRFATGIAAARPSSNGLRIPQGLTMSSFAGFGRDV